jgi:type IV pilus assembly protein PilM
MAKELGVWGIDLGQCALKAIRLQEVDGQLTATAFDYVEHPKILSQPDADPDALTREALEKFLSRNSLRGDMVVISVPGQSGLARFVKLPPVEEKKISDIVRFEAKQQIPFNLEEVVWDYQKIGSGIVTDGFAMETEIGLFAMKRDMIGKYLQHFKDVKVEVHIVQMAPLALCNFVAYDLLKKGAAGEDGEEEAGGKTKNCVVALDIGSDSSNLIITDGDRIIWQRPIPLGGNHFTRALTKDLKLTFAKAEHLKRNATKSPDLKKILAALKPVLNDFVGEVQRSLGYFTNTHRDAHVEYMVGLGNAFRLPGLQRFLAEKLQLDVRKLAKLERLNGEVLNSPTYSDNILSFAVAYGLAVQGLKHSRLVTNLLPGEIRIERMVRAKKPWALTAAACLLITSASMALDSYLEYRSYGAKEVVDAEARSKQVLEALANAESDFNKAKDQANAEEKAVRAIVAGQAEQRNWLKIVKFIGGLAPQPDGEDFPPEHKAQYWEKLEKSYGEKGGNTGKHAYQEYSRRMQGLTASLTESGAAVADDLSRGIDDLILFNIESVDCRFAGDLGATWSAIRNGMQEPDRANVRPESHWDAAPVGPGWVFELKGYTYHHKRGLFVVDGLVENIARLGAPKEDGDAKPGAAPAAKSDAKPDAKQGAKPPEPAAKPADQGAKPPADAAKGGDKAPAKATLPALPKDLKGLEAACKAPFTISHVVLYRTATTRVTGYGHGTPTLGSVLDGVVAGGGGPVVAGGGGGGIGGAKGGGIGPVVTAAAPAAGGGGGGGWTPLLGTSGAALVSGGGGGGGGGGEVAPAARSLIRRRMGAGDPDAGGGSGGGGGMPPPSVATTAAPTTALAAGQHDRTDFIVLFFWQEPTPSDQLRQLGGARK